MIDKSDAERLRLITLTMALSPDDFALLEVLGTPISMPADLVAKTLALYAIDGVRRPGSWERGWVKQAFGDDFVQLLEVDPAVAYYRRVKK